MLLPALHNFATGQAIQFVLIFTPDPERPHAAPLLCGFFPLQPHRLYKGLPVPNVRLWQHRHCFSCTPLLRTEFARECLLAFFNWLAAGSRCGVLLEMPVISGDGPFHQVLTDVLNQRGNVFSVLQTFTRALFRPRENGDAYLQAALSGE